MKGNFQVRFLEGGGQVTARLHSAWLRGGRNPPGSFFASVDTQPARGNRGWQGIDPGFRLPPTNLCGHFLRKAPFCWPYLSANHLIRKFVSRCCHTYCFSSGTFS